MEVVINAIFTDEYFTEKLSTIDIAAETIDVLLDYHISKKIMFETIKGNPEYKEQTTKILSE